MIGKRMRLRGGKNPELINKYKLQNIADRVVVVAVGQVISRKRPKQNRTAGREECGFCKQGKKIDPDLSGFL
jgi:hypothetical protein